MKESVVSSHFNDASHTLAKSEDGSYTAYSKEYDEHYHSTKDGALSESLYKHIIPAYKHCQEKEEVCILDICYGLGFNTLATILYYKEHAPEKKLRIYSPELDEELVKSLAYFTYPDGFEGLKSVIESLSTQGKYEDENLFIELFLGDARAYIKQFHHSFDVVYQDAFSPHVNPILWTQEYFLDLKNAMRKDGILTTYSTALKTRLALYQNGFYIYINSGEAFRTATLASLEPLHGYEVVNMVHKIACNPSVEPLQDTSL
jgi:tRNA U34 5-methylaminomethyl-2-thiouridine-forming methyltransferase MnmC